MSRFRLDTTPQSATQPRKPRSYLQICIWDNGKGIASTLEPLLKAGQPIRALHLPPYMWDRIFVDFRNFDEEVIHSTVVDQGEEIDSEGASEARLLLASFFPGISRNVDSSVAPVEPLDSPASSSTIGSAVPGMGLYALARTVLDQFQGQLFVRSGRHRLVMEMAHDAYRKVHSVRYKARITSYPEDYPAFRGNLLTMVLPITRASDVKQ